MALVTSETATVYRGGGRRWFTIAAACRAEARKKVKKRWNDAGLDVDDFDPDKYQETVARLSRLYRRATLASREG